LVVGSSKQASSSARHSWTPSANAVKAGSWARFDRAEEVVEAAFGLAPVGGAVNRPEALLESPGLGDQWLAFE
jgi:hypothetical protein